MADWLEWKDYGSGGYVWRIVQYNKYTGVGTKRLEQTSVFNALAFS